MGQAGALQKMLQLKWKDLPHHSPTTGTAEFCPLDLEDDYMGKWRRPNTIKYEKKYAFPVPDGLWNHHSLSLFPQHSSTQTERNTLPKELDGSSGSPGCEWMADPGRSSLSPPGSVRAEQLLWVTVSHRTMMRVSQRNAELQ